MRLQMLPTYRGLAGYLRGYPAFSLLVVCSLYALGINPYFLPDTYDNVAYYFGAVSIAETAQFKWQDQFISNYPPMLSCFLAVPFAVGLQSVVVAKGVILLFVALSLFLAYRLLRREDYPYALAACVVAGLGPTAFMMGTRIMTEWPFTALSFIFLLAVDALRERHRSLKFAVMVGVVLGVASLTRYMGVLLGVALVAQAVHNLRRVGRSQWRSAVLPEVVAAFCGAAIFLAWWAKLKLQLATGEAASNYYQESDWLQPFEPVALLQSIGDLQFNLKALCHRFLGGHALAEGLLVTLPGLVTMMGMVHRLRTRGWSPSDWYVLASLILLGFVAWKNTRYLVPLSPFLASYFILEVQYVTKSLASWLLMRGRPSATQWCRLIAVPWVILLLPQDLYLLLKGNGKTHAGLLYATSPTPDAFYRGYWSDLYELCSVIKHSSDPGRVAVEGLSGKYVRAFTEREVEVEPITARPAYLLEERAQGSQTESVSIEQRGKVEITSRGVLTLYRLSE